MTIAPGQVIRFYTTVIATLGSGLGAIAGMFGLAELVADVYLDLRE